MQNKKTETITRVRITKNQKDNWNTYLNLNGKTETEAIRAFIDSCIEVLPSKLRKSGNALNEKNKKIDDILKTMEMNFEK